MSTPTDGRTSLEAAEAWWAFVARILSFFLGATILGWQSFIATSDRIWIILAGIGLCGLAVAEPVALMLTALKNALRNGGGT